VQTQCCELFYLFLIKKELMFLQMVVRVLATRVLGKIGKAMYNGKIKTKKKDMYSLKNKN